jgi:hypothetical protein
MNVRDFNVRDLGTHIPSTDRVLEAVGLTRRPTYAIAPPSTFAAFGLGLLVGVGLGLLLQVTSALEDETEAEEPALS